MADFYRQLAILRNDWADCTACELGQRRDAAEGKFVFGEGARRGVMFIGEGPGKDEEVEGRPFVGRSGSILRHVIKKLSIDPVYITNVVTCRSCGQAYDTEGNPRYRKNWKTGVQYPDIRDQPPTPAQMNTCMPRLHEEIYLVDPILIVTLGREATQVLTKSSVGILEASGTMMSCTIPGHGFHATVTEKKQAWVRKVRKQLVMPTVKNDVVYPVIPILHPAYILRNKEDRRPGNPLEKFVDGMRTVRDVYYRYVIEVRGDFLPPMTDLTEEDILELEKDED